MSGPENVGRCSAGYVYIPGGTFKMGSENGDSNERPVHDVTVSSFCMKETELTNTEYEVPSRGRSEYSAEDNQPVTNVSWFDADRYCRSIGGRLPTEAEWEYAASVGGKNIFGTKSGSKEKLGEEACFNKNKTCDVKEYPPNENGLYGMSGNVWEWVSDWYDGSVYEYTAVKDPTGPEKGDSKVLRGGSWADYGSSFLRAALRFNYRPDGGRVRFGFRCAVAPQK